MTTALLCYGATFIGGFLLSFALVEDLDWRECIACGIVHAVVYGSVLYLVVLILPLLIHG